MRSKVGKKNMRVCSVRRGIQTWGREPLGPMERAPKYFEKLFFEKKEYMRCVENTYVVSRCRRGEWYIWLCDVGKM